MVDSAIAVVLENVAAPSEAVAVEVKPRMMRAALPREPRGGHRLHPGTVLSMSLSLQRGHRRGHAAAADGRPARRGPAPAAPTMITGSPITCRWQRAIGSISLEAENTHR